MAALGSLVVKLALDYAAYTSGLGQASQQSLGAAKRIQDGMDAVGARVSSAMAKIGGVIAGGLSVGALVSQINQVKNAAVEVDRFASLAGASLQEFQRFAAGASSVGIGLEKVGDITKDVNDKIGEFLLTGGGEMKDFFEVIAPKVGVTAKEFANLSGPQALQLYYRTLERAGVGQQIMTTQMEALANDASLLAPLLANNGAEMQRLADQAERSGLVMSDSLIASSRQLQEDVNILGGAFTGLRNSLAEGVIPELSNASRAFTEAMTQTGGLNEEAQRLSRDGSVSNWVRSVVVGLSYVMDVGQGAIGIVRMLGKAAAGAVVANMEAISSIGGAAGQALRGNFSDALQTLKGGAASVKGTILAVGTDISEIWGESLAGERFRAALDSQVALAKSTGQKVKEGLGTGAAVIGAGAGKSSQESDYDKLVKKIQERIHASQAELAAGRELTEQEKFAAGVMESVGTAKQKLTQAERDRVVALLKESGALDESAQAQRLRTEAEKEFRATEAQRVAAYEKTIEAATESNKQLREEVEMIGLTEQQQLAVTQARIADTIAQKEQTLAGLQRDSINMREQVALEEEIRLLRERSELLGQQSARTTAAKQVEAYRGEWTKFYDSLYNGLTDSLYRSFEAGGKFFKSMWEGIKNLAKTTVLKFGIQGVMGLTPLGALASTTNGGAGGAGGGALGMANNASSAYSLYGVANTAYTGGTSGLVATYAGSGSYAGYAAGLSSISPGAVSAANAAGTVVGGDSIAYLAATEGWTGAGGSAALANGSGAAASGAANGGWMSGAGGAAVGVAGGLVAGQLISGGYSAMGKNSMSATATGTAAGAAIGTWVFPGIGTALGGLIGGIVGGVVNRAFGRKAPEVTDQGIAATVGQNLVIGTQYQNYIEKGGWFRSDRRSQEVRPLDAAQVDALKTATQAVYGSIAGYGKALGLGADAISGYTQDIILSTKGMTDEQITAALDAQFASFADQLAARIAPGIGEFAKSGEQYRDTLTRLAASMGTVNGVMDSLGQRALDLSLAGGAAAAALLEMVGGAEGLQTLASGYLANFYTEAERSAIALRQVGATLASAGLGMPQTRSEFRALVEAQDLMTASGRQAYLALLGVADAFASAVPEAQALAAAQKQAMQGGYDVLERSVEAQRKLVQAQYDSASAAVSKLASMSDRLRSTIDGMTLSGTDAGSRAAAQAQVAAALATARAGGAGVVDMDALAPALSRVAQSSEGLFDDYVSYARDYARTMADLQELTSLTGGAQSVAEQELAAAQGQLDRLDYILQVSKEHVDAINGVNASTVGVRDAVVGLAGLFAAATGVDHGAYAAGALAGYLVPAHADGGRYAGGMALVGEEGPELINFRSPGQVYTAAQTQALLAGGGGNAELLAELRELRREVAAFRATNERQTDRVIDHTDQAAATLRDAAKGDRPLVTTTAEEDA